ncbi:MAG: threonine/serine dehydratase [Thermovirgaceae bacterium]
MYETTVPEMEDILFAKEFLKTRVRKTPTDLSEALFEKTIGPVVLKWENLQVCGAFKIRGALNKMFSLSPEERKRGVVTASSGNHAQGVATAASMLGVKAVICVPGSCPENKKRAIQKLGGEYVELKVIGKFYDEAETEAKRLCHEVEMVYVSAYEDLHIIAGQGTVGFELLEVHPDLDVILVPISGGGLITGVTVAAKALRRGIEVWGVYAKANPSWRNAWEKGFVEPVEEEKTLADALSGAASPVLFSYLRENLAGLVEVDEEEIASAISFLHREHHQVVEGAGATGVAALLSGKFVTGGKKTGVVVSGGNIDEDQLLRILGIS